MIFYFDKSKLDEYQGIPICIVGSGAAGISLAISLIRKGKKVLLIDGGMEKDQPDLNDAYHGRRNKPHPPLNEYRRQRFGGTTHLWGGRCVPYDKYDFSERNYIPVDGWPIDYYEINKFLPEALDYCDAGINDFGISSLEDESPMFLGLNKVDSEIKERIERYSLPTDFASKFYKELAQSDLASVMLKARCIHINVNEQGDKVISITISDGKDVVELRSEVFVISGGGLETTRLLMASQESCEAWRRFNNSLGHYYGCHYDVILGRLCFSHKNPQFDFQKTKDGVYARRKLQFTEDFLEKEQLLNSTFRLHFPAYSDFNHGSGIMSAIYLLKSILPKEHQDILDHGGSYENAPKNYLAHLRNVFIDFFSVFKFSFVWLFKIKLAKRRLPYTLIANRNMSYPLEFNSEQIPSFDNRIELLPEKDKFGMPKIAIYWSLTEKDIESGVKSFKLLQGLVKKIDGCELELDSASLRKDIASALPVGGHHIGTTRMGNTSEDSVVDKNCQVHGVTNLFIASSSVFPTCSHANPTLTIVALALRLSDYLSSKYL